MKTDPNKSVTGISLGSLILDVSVKTPKKVAVKIPEDIKDPMKVLAIRIGEIVVKNKLAVLYENLNNLIEQDILHIIWSAGYSVEDDEYSLIEFLPSGISCEDIIREIKS